MYHNRRCEWGRSRGIALEKDGRSRLVTLRPRTDLSLAQEVSVVSFQDSGKYTRFRRNARRGLAGIMRTSRPVRISPLISRSASSR